MMKIQALSNYRYDTDTRFGDCILCFDRTHLVVYDCGHTAHVEYVMSFLGTHSAITQVSIVTSHNDSDHTDGICDLLDRLRGAKKYDMTLYTPLYLKSTTAVMKVLDDSRRKRHKTQEHILDTFDHIAEIVERAQALGIQVKDTAEGTTFAGCVVVGPTVEEFSNVVAKAIDNASSDAINGETVMNAASVQLKCPLDGGGSLLLCGDATPDYLHALEDYAIIQLPHHGKLDSAIKIFNALEDAGDEVDDHDFLISDNTGTAQNSGGSDDLVKHMKALKYKPAYNTKDGIVCLPPKGIIGGGVPHHVLGY